MTRIDGDLTGKTSSPTKYSASLTEEVAGVLAPTVPLGMPSGKIGLHPGWKPLQGSTTIMSQARLMPVPAPRTRPKVPASLRSVGFSTPRPQQAPPSERQIWVCGAECAYVRGKNSTAGHGAVGSGHLLREVDHQRVSLVLTRSRRRAPRARPSCGRPCRCTPCTWPCARPRGGSRCPCRGRRPPAGPTRRSRTRGRA